MIDDDEKDEMRDGLSVNACEQTVRSKMLWRILVPSMALIIFSSLDRVNISFAALRMNQDLGLTPESFGFAVGLFFVGYLACQFPSTYLQRRWGTRRWIFTIVLFWGICAVSLAFVQNKAMLYVLRFLLGVGESGLAPGMTYYCTRAMPRRFRAGAIATTLVAVPISVIIGGPLSGWLLSSQNPVDIAGWRWMFLLEGLPTIALAFVAYRLFPNQPTEAEWLTADERDWLKQELRQEQASFGASVRPTSLVTLLSNPRLWAIAGVWFALLLGSNGIIFWLPQVLKQLSGASDLAIGIMSAVPWLGIGLGMMLNARHSDRTQERYWHVGIAAVVAAIGIVAALSLGPSAPALACLFIGGLGIGGGQGVFWTLSNSLLSEADAGVGITLINLLGNIGSLTGPYLIGLFREQTGSFAAPIYGIAVILVLAAFLLIPVRQSLQEQS